MRSRYIYKINPLAQKEYDLPQYITVSSEHGYDSDGYFWARIGQKWSLNLMARADTVWKLNDGKWYKIKCRENGVSLTVPESDEQQMLLYSIFYMYPDAERVIDRLTKWLHSR